MTLQITVLALQITLRPRYLLEPGRQQLMRNFKDYDAVQWPSTHAALH